MKHIRMFRIALVVLGASFAISSAMADDKLRDLKPKYTSLMTVSGYTGETELENFPVAVRISPETISGFKYEKCDGQGDISFTDVDGNILPHEIEVWNTAGESVAWVSVPKLSTVVAEDTTTYTTFKMHWGHEKKLADSKPQDVWSVSTYNGVWHLAESSGEIKDSSSAARGMSVVTTRSCGTTTDEAKIGSAFWVKSSEDSNGAEAVLKTNKGFTMGYSSDCTVTGWIYISNFAGNNNNPIGPYKKSNTYYWQLYPYSSWSKVLLRFKSTEATTTAANLAPKKAGWFHYTVVIHKKANFDLYVKGEYSGSYTPKKDGSVQTGYYKYGEVDRDYFYLYLCGYPGYLDETRIRDTLSSDDWIKAEYDSINNKQFVVAAEATKNSYGLSVIVR